VFDTGLEKLPISRAFAKGRVSSSRVLVSNTRKS
jgi:hypothetical protein